MIEPFQAGTLLDPQLLTRSYPDLRPERREGLKFNHHGFVDGEDLRSRDAGKKKLRRKKLP